MYTIYSKFDALKAWKTFHNLLKLLLYTGNGVDVPLCLKPSAPARSGVFPLEIRKNLIYSNNPYVSHVASVSGPPERVPAFISERASVDKIHRCDLHIIYTLSTRDLHMIYT